MPGETNNSQNNVSALEAVPSYLNVSHNAFAGNIFPATSSEWESYIRRSGMASSISSTNYSVRLKFNFDAGGCFYVFNL